MKMGIDLVDQIVLGDSRYCSFKEGSIVRRGTARGRRTGTTLAIW
jgi:hypothetical protein